MDIMEPIKKWLFGIALKKGIVSAAKLIVSWAVAQGVKLSFSIGGVLIDTTNEAVMVVAINSLLTVLRNFLKTKYPKTFGWL